MSECFKFKNKEYREKINKPQPNGCAAVKSTVTYFIPDAQVKGSESESFMEDFKLFISERFVSLKGDNAILRPIMILCELLSLYYLMVYYRCLKRPRLVIVCYVINVMMPGLVFGSFTPRC